MAKKDNRRYIFLQCTICKNKNYTSKKNYTNNKERLELNKFCNTCKKHTLHKEVK
ncbi:MAG: 50S ribosomal protein L33 [Patescibacteria group bacterium]|jgi:large subunit ribosomal protein L33